MEFSSLTFFVTEDCNFNCTYCYQKKRKNYLDFSLLEKAIAFFFPFLKNESYINFYGGEPLLAFDQIKHAIAFIEAASDKKAKNFKYTLTTNGSLLDDKKLAFLSQHNFSLLLSFDGLAQKTHRKKNSFDPIVASLKKISKCPDIEFETNSVFTPRTIHLLFESIRFISELGVPSISFALSQTSDWRKASFILYKEQLEALKQYLISFFQRKGYIPSVNFRRFNRRGVFACYASRDRMAMTADGKLWGCHLFADVYKGKEYAMDYAKFCFGDLESFMENHEEIYSKISANYTNLRVDQYYTTNGSCIDCFEMEECQVCPMDNMIQGQNFQEIPDWVCEQKRITRETKRKFWMELGDVPSAERPRKKES